MPTPFDRLRGDDRGVSETVGYVLLFGMVAAGAGMLLLYGSSAVDEVTQQANEESASKSIRQVAQRFESLSSNNGITASTLDLGNRQPSTVDVVREGLIRVQVNERSTCTSEVVLSSVRYENEDGGTMAYEAGGIFRGDPDTAGSAMVNPPSLAYRNETIDLTIANITGSITDEENTLVKNVTRSTRKTQQLTGQLFQGDCKRPDNVTITVESDYHEAWGRYLKDEFNYTSYAEPGSDTVQVFLNQSKLPVETDDSRNRVVNLTHPGNYLSLSTNSTSIQVAKPNRSAPLRVSVRPLGGGPQYSEVRRIVAKSPRYRDPIDVAFVFDESGSMANDYDGNGATRTEEAQAAAQGFVAEMNGSYDRVSVLGFTAFRRLHPVDGQIFSSDFTAVNDTINNSLKSSGNTNMAAGLNQSNSVFALKSNNTREKAVILLSDGQNSIGGDSWYVHDSTSDMNERTRLAANISAGNGITVYTIAYGGSAGNAVLRDVANLTGGKFYKTSSSSQLKQVFKDIFTEISSQEAVVYDPATMRVATNKSGTFYPQLDANVSRIGSYTTAGGDTVPNLNDPTVQSDFRFTFLVTDQENVTMNAVTYGRCSDDNLSRTGATVVNGTNASTQYPVVRCTGINTSKQNVTATTETKIFTADDSLSDVESFVGDDHAPWQDDDNLTDIVPTESGDLDLASNQALVAYNLTNSGRANNRMLVLYEIGRANANVETSYVIDFRVSNITVRSRG